MLPPDKVLRSSSNDVRDFYYFFEVSDARARRKCFAGAVRSRDLAGCSALTPELAQHQWLYGSLATLAMGDLQAVAIAQTCHVGLALRHANLRTAEFLTGKGPIPRGPEYTGIVIDDYVSLSQVPRESLGPSPGAARADAIHDLYHTVGLVPHTEKSERDQSVGNF